MVRYREQGFEAGSVVAERMVDFSFFEFLVPVFVFVLVVFILGAILKKTELLGKDNWISVIVAILIALVFVSFSDFTELLTIAIPWMAVLVFSLFFIMALVKFMGSDNSILGKGLGWFFVIATLVIFVASTMNAFSVNIISYLPGPYFGISGDVETLLFFDWLYSPVVSGTLGVIIAGGIAFWVFVRK